MTERMMTRDEFREGIKEAIIAQLPDNYEVFVQKVDKPSGAYTGVGAREKGSMIAPIINTEPFYQRYLEAEVVEDLAEEMVDIIMNTPRPQEDNLMNFAHDYKQVKGRLFIKALNGNKIPEKVVRKMEADIALVPYVLINEDETGFAAFAVTSDLLNMWGVEEQQIIEDAFMNADELFPAMVTSLAEELGVEEREVDIRIVSNKKHQNGAAAAFYPSMLDRISRIYGGDFMLLPSSVHEMLAMPVGNPVQLAIMVAQINRECVDERDQLTNSVYRYYHDRKELVKEG